MKLAIFQWFLSMVGLDMDMVHKYSYTTHMSYGQNLVHGERTSLSRVGPYRFCSGGTLYKPSWGYRFRVGPYRFCSDGYPTTLSILLWSYLILSDTHMFCNCFTSVYTLECGSAMICSQGGIIDPASHNVWQNVWQSLWQNTLPHQIATHFGGHFFVEISLGFRWTFRSNSNY